MLLRLPTSKGPPATKCRASFPCVAGEQTLLTRRPSGVFCLGLPAGCPPVSSLLASSLRTVETVLLMLRESMYICIRCQLVHHQPALPAEPAKLCTTAGFYPPS